MKVGKGKLLIGGLAGLAAVAAVAAPYGLGMSVERELRASADRAQASPYIDSWTVARYERGWGTAQASSEITLVVPGTEEAVDLTVEHDITHGPYSTGGDIGRVESTVRIAGGALEPVLDGMYRDRAPLTVDQAIGPTGRITIDFESPQPARGWEGEAGTFAWRGMNGRVVLEDGGSAVEYVIESDGLAFDSQQAEGSAEIAGITLTGDQQRDAASGVWTGESTAAIRRVGFDTDEGEPRGLRDIEARSSAAIDNGLLSMDSTVTIPDIRLPDYESLTDFRLRFDADRLSPAFVGELQTMATEIEKAATQEEKKRIARRAMQSLDWQAFARPGPRIRIESLRLRTAAGKLEAGVTAELDGVGEDDEITAPFQLMRFAKAEASLRTPTELLLSLMADMRAATTDASAEQARALSQQRVTALAERGILVLDEGRASLDASYDQGSIRINGRSLAQLMR